MVQVTDMRMAFSFYGMHLHDPERIQSYTHAYLGQRISPCCHFSGSAGLRYFRGRVYIFNLACGFPPCISAISNVCYSVSSISLLLSPRTS